VNQQAVILVLVSGLIHSSWNYLAKRSRDKLSFLWSAKVIAILLLLPLFIYRIAGNSNSCQETRSLLALMGFGAASGFVHFAYVYFLSKAYRYGDISFSYPIARGVAPFLVTLLSLLFLNELPTLAGLAGMALILFGIGFLVKSRASNDSRVSNFESGRGSILSRRKPFVFALLTSVMIALYIFIDGIGSRDFSPFVFMYAYSVISTFFLTLPILNRVENVIEEIKLNCRWILVTGAMMPLSYFLALNAMRLTQLGYVASLRNVSVLFATVYGVIKLKEPLTPFRLAGSLVIFLGALLISL